MLLYNKVMKNVTRKGKKMARRAGFQINREDIIRAAIKQISKYGFSNFTLSNLSKELNITKAALYWHFKSKNDILMEVLKYIELEYISKISEICDDKSLSASEKLKNYLKDILESLTRAHDIENGYFNIVFDGLDEKDKTVHLEDLVKL